MDENLKREVKTYLEQGYSPIQIKQALTQKGHTIAQIDEAISINYKKQAEPKSDKKKVIIIASIILAIIGISLFFILTLPSQEYSNNPKDWIITHESGLKEINITQATKGAGYIDDVGLQYEQGNISTVFAYDGIYNGEIFTNTEYVFNDTIKLRISKDQTPSDNIPEAYIIERIENGRVYAHIFVDNDWKNIIGNTNIIWGEAYQNIKKFNFTEITPGLYYDTIEDDASRFSDNYKGSVGGIIVGSVTMQEIEEKDLSKATLIRLI